ncbi:Hypothetical predicted protein [Paramuricea clavata]|uniref:Uncharacterized protein n=1 Tax=Paramuricea clavata TaxID=317549 RepID=A0A6S7FNP0_PARCT|nr:Hypothetical predicted protein [Paramuricea clavata]
MAEWKNRLMSRFGGKKTKDDAEEKKTGKKVCFQKKATVYSDSIIVDAIPQQTQSSDENDNYIKENGLVETKEKHLTRQQVEYMLKNRFKDDLGEWKSRKDQRPVDVCSEPSRSPKLSTRKRYGYAPKSPDITHPTLPRKIDHKSGTVWLQCGEEIKQVRLPNEAVKLDHIRQIFKDNFQSELKNYSHGAERGILLIRDPFTRAFKELNDVRHVLPGSHLKLLAPKKKPCRSPEHEQLSRSFTFDERRRSRSFNSETFDALSTTSVPTGISRARAGSYSFHGTTKTGYIVTPKRHIVTSTPKFSHNTMHPGKAFPNDLSRTSHINKPDSSRERSTVPSSPGYGKPQTFNQMSPRYMEAASPSQKVKLTGIGSRLNSSEVRRPPRSPVEEQLASLTDLLEEAMRTDSVSDVTSYDNSIDSLYVPPRPAYLYYEKNKMRTASDSGTESLISENCGHSSIELIKKKPPPPRRNSSKETVKTLSFQKQHEENKQESSNVESPRRSIVRPKVWVDTSHRARDNSIKVTAAYLKKDVKQMKIQLEELRNQHECNSHIFYSMISQTGKRITRAIEAVMPDAQTNTNIHRQKMRDEESAYQRRSDNAEKTMRRLENEIEMLRDAAVNYKSRAKQSELNDIHRSIENLNRSVTSLKSDFETLSNDARGIMAEEKHSLFEEERFFKEEPVRLDQFVDRCRHAVGNLHSLQKLASAQPDVNELSRIRNTSSSVTTLKIPMKETDTIKRKESYRRGTVVTQISHKTKVEYGGTTTSANYNQNTVSQGNVAKTKVRFNDSPNSITYHQ